MPKNNPVEQALTPPAAEQVARLHALAEESKTVAQRINYPITAILFYMFLYFFKYIDTLMLLAFTYILENIKASDSKIYILTCLIGAATEIIIFYLYSKIFCMLSTPTNFIFPNGFLLSRKNHAAHEMLQKLGTAEKVEEATKSLEKLVASQNTSARRSFIGSLALNLLVPPLAAWMSSTSDFQFGYYRPSLSRLGPRLVYQHSEKNQRIGILIQLSGDFQSLLTVTTAYNFWKNFSSKKQIDTYQKQLKQLSGNVYDWKVHAEHGKSSALFSLAIKSPTAAFLNPLKQKQTIEKEVYFIELQRILREEGITVYSAGEKEIHVAFSSLSKETTQRLQTKLLSRFVNIKQCQEKSDQIISQLNRLSVLIDRELFWDSYTDYGTSTLDTYYFLDSTTITKEFSTPLMTALISIISDGVSEDRGIIKINRNDFEISDKSLKTAVQKLSQEVSDLYVKQKATPSQANLSQHEDTSMGARLPTKKVKKAIAACQQVARPLAQAEPSPYPATIFFPKIGLKRIRTGATMPADANDMAFPLHIKRLPEGKAYAIIHPLVFLNIMTFVSQGKVLHYLESGQVHGAKAEDKSKVGPGIKLAAGNPGYKDVENVEHQSSTLIMKIGNIRIFADKIDETADGDYQVHRFDGVGYGH